MQNTTNPALPPAAVEDNDEHARTCPHARRRHGFLAGLVLGMLGAGLVGFAIGATMPVAEAALGALSHRHGDGPRTVEDAREHADFFVSFALHRLDASDAQETRVQEIVDGAIGQLFPVVEQHRANRDVLRGIIGSPQIDRAALEKLRAEEMALADTMSRIVTSAVADSAEVLTAEQRGELIERLERFRHHR